VRRSEAELLREAAATAAELRAAAAASRRAAAEASRASRTAANRQRDARAQTAQMKELLLLCADVAGAEKRTAGAAADRRSASEASLRLALDNAHRATRLGLLEAKDAANKEGEVVEHGRGEGLRHAARAAARVAERWMADAIVQQCRKEAFALTEELAERKLDARRCLLHDDLASNPLGSSSSHSHHTGAAAKRERALARLERRSEAARLALVRAEVEMRGVVGAAG